MAARFYTWYAALYKACSAVLLQAGHALVGALMPEYDPVQKISIVPRGQAGGLTFFAPSEERLESGLYSRSYLENQARALSGCTLLLLCSHSPACWSL